MSILVDSASPWYCTVASLRSIASPWNRPQRHDLIRDSIRPHIYNLVLLGRHFQIFKSPFILLPPLPPTLTQPCQPRTLTTENPSTDIHEPTTRRQATRPCAADDAQDVSCLVRLHQCLAYRLPICDVVSPAPLKAFASSQATAFHALQRLFVCRRNEVVSGPTPETICRKRLGCPRVPRRCSATLVVALPEASGAALAVAPAVSHVKVVRTPLTPFPGADGATSSSAKRGVANQTSQFARPGQRLASHCCCQTTIAVDQATKT